MGAFDDIPPEVQAEAAAKKQRALDQITVGRRYRHKMHPSGEWDVVVTDVDHQSYVWWRRATGPGPADNHRSMYVTDFVGVYESVKTAGTNTR